MATLKISDVSVGDWVRCGQWNGRIQRIAMGDGETVEVIIEGDCGSLYMYKQIYEINPIPITPEILEVNGFEEHCGGIFRYEWMWQGESSGITLCSFDEELWFVDLFFKEGKDIMCNIPTFSVHQLQHILRLAGVEKEIVMPNK